MAYQEFDTEATQAPQQSRKRAQAAVGVVAALVCLGLAVSGGARGQGISVGSRRLEDHDDGDCVDDKDWYHKNRGPDYDCAWVAAYPSKRCDLKGVDNVLASEGCKATCGTCGDSDVVALWYKPHYQCGASAGSTPDAAAAFINAQMDGRSDFVGIGEWAPIASGDDDEGVPAIGSPDYGSVAAVCGYGSSKYTTSVELFHDKRRWDLVASRPGSPNCADVVPLPPWDAAGFTNADCIARTSPGDDDCCSCTFSEEEYRTADEWGQGLGQRPWVAGIYKRKSDATELCVVACVEIKFQAPHADDAMTLISTQVVAGEFPHPLANQTLWNLNGAPTWSVTTSAATQPFSIAKDICTTQYSAAVCVPNLEGTSVMFGTDVFVRGVEDFCGTRPVVVMLDTNAGMGDFASSEMFLDSSLQGKPATLEPYTCCNDTDYDGGLNRYASDRVMVAGGLEIDALEGGSVAPGGPLPDDLSYTCHAAEEHAPIRAHISTK